MKQDSLFEPNLIRARSQRQALDWSLALLSQGIESTLVEADGDWALQVPPGQVGKAARILRIYQVENRTWLDYFRPVPHGPAFHPGAFVWCILVVLAYVAVVLGPPGLADRGMCETTGLWQGQWWRLWTAVSLHADLRHLLGNLTLGTLLLGFAMARHGAGWAQLVCLLSAVGANLFSALLHGAGHRGLGASGMVMAALGLLAVGSVQRPQDSLGWAGWALRGLMAAVLLFVLIGLAPASDVVAHAGGFVGGLALGTALLKLPTHWRGNLWVNHATAMFALVMMLAAWFAALRHQI